VKSASSEEEFVKFILEGQPEPPLYFARMKRDNRRGPAVVGGVPSPKHLTQKELEELSQKENAVILDTRDRGDFVSGHIPGSLSSPLNKQFNTVAGSYVTEDKEINLVVRNHDVEEATRDLYRIGLDNVAGYCTPEDLLMYKEQGGEMQTMDMVTFDVADNGDENSIILDVRKATEFEESHIEGAINIAHTRLLDRKDEIPADKKIYVHCMTGARSAVAAAFLQSEGFDVAQVDDLFTEYMAKTASA